MFTLHLLRLWAHAERTERTWKRSLSSDRKVCYKKLRDISSVYYRSLLFADEGDQRDTICALILVLKSLDTIEDDMQIDADEKEKHLLNFHSYLDLKEWNYTASSLKRDKHLLEEFSCVLTMFVGLAPGNKEKIRLITKSMGEGMNKYRIKNIKTFAEMRDYFSYIAADLIKISFRIWCENLNPPVPVPAPDELLNSVGYFAQEVDNIEDFYEDTKLGLYIWPEEVWIKYCTHPRELLDPDNQDKAVACLNEMICEAFLHFPSSVRVTSALNERDKKLMMAYNLAFLSETSILRKLFNNPKVFTAKRVKLSTKTKINIFVSAQNESKSMKWLTKELMKMLEKNLVTVGATTSQIMSDRLTEAIELCKARGKKANYNNNG